MTLTIQSIITALDSFEPASDGDNVSHLNRILEGFRAIKDRTTAVSAIFSLLERFPEADFGMPGPLVHELEAIPGYEAELINSLKRQPTPLTIWMVNRILNGAKEKVLRESWLIQLRLASNHPSANSNVRASAQHFIEYQTNQSSA